MQAENATSTSNETTTATSPSAEEVELEKRKARAARFGIPLVEPSKPKAPKPMPQKNGVKAAVSPEVTYI